MIIEEKYSYQDLISECKRLTEKDKVREHSRDDYGLGNEWFFHFGSWENNKWVCYYAKPTQKALDIAKGKLIGNIGSIRYERKGEHLDNASIVIGDEYMIGQIVIRLNETKTEFE